MALRDSFLQSTLAKRENEGLLRQLSQQKNLVDFYSNDYLGFARSEELKKRTELLLEKSLCKFINGSTGSRLISGNSDLFEETEKQIASFHNAEAGLIFNSGYDANLGLFSSVPKRGDTILYDEFSHASIIDGIRLSFAFAYKFRHNDLNHLEEKLKIAKARIFVAVESVYSMDGDIAPLKEMVSLCEKYNANLIVDEAHATGVFGKKGEGLCSELGVEKKTFARVHTFGKALGCHGAIVLGNLDLKNYLINFARSFIYTTALPPQSVATIQSAYVLLSECEEKITSLKKNIQFFKKKIQNIERFIESESPIQSVIIGGNEKTINCATEICKMGFDVKAILSPTVPKETERLRICLHAFNTENEIIGLADSINAFIFKK